MNTETDRDSFALDPKPMTTAIGATAAMTLVGADQGHFTGDDSRSHHRSGKHHYRPARGSSSSSHTASWKSKDRKHKQVTIDDLLLDYYDSDDNDSNSDDDLN